LVDDKTMRVIIAYPDGSLRPGRITVITGSQLRASALGCDDAVEFRLAGGRWLAENGDAIEIYLNVPDHEFQALVRHTAGGGAGSSDALEVYLWSIYVPDSRPSVRVD
jgi:hypothetical protein